MFKLESYIAPILLSYVDKYIKNFRLEDSQVSLWGGDAIFQNLDLRLEVLEQELQSPFSFISGHIKELSIHVPWTKLTSEPITITINTIECVLKLKDASDGVASDTSPLRDKPKRGLSHKGEDEAPPNYVQLLINKIVSNIRIFCNNLILKYVEEDIVLSMNVKHLKVESCNEKWESAYSDISSTQVVMRKIIGVNDLTVCLDKRNASGKIDFYQEPMLYRCSMTMHLLRTYNSSTANKTSLTRLDIYCNNMEFSMTEQQVPMFMRLIALLQALNQKQLRSCTDLQDNLSVSSENKEGSTSNETWSGWAWSYVAAVLPTQWDDDPENQQLFTHSGHIMQIGFYVDDASLTFKVSETSHEKGYYNQKKIRYHPLLTLQLAGIYSETILVGRIWSNSTFGISEILLIPVGSCSCSHPEPGDTFPYLVIGSKANNHKSNSLFDLEAIENSGSKQYRTYNTVWDFHIFTNRDVVLLERTPALVFDYIYQMELPEDTTSDILSDLGSNLEYSNMSEKACNRIFFGSLKFRVCSGFFHRIDSLKIATTTYDYPPYYLPKPDPLLHDLLPPSEEDFDALNEFIPTRITKIMFFEPIIELYFMDHPFFEPSKEVLFKRAKKVSTATTPTIQLQKLPKLTIECKSIELDFCNPMYINRLIHTTCQLPEPPDKMFAACFSILDINIVGLSSRLILKQNNSTTLIIPFNVSCQRKSIISPQYWVKPDIAHVQTTIQLENLTFNCTKPKLIVVSHLITNLFKRNTDGLQSLRCTSLLYDACKDHHMPYLELYIEGIRFKRNETISTITIDVALDCIKAFVFESNENSDIKMNSIQQVLFLSGPEPKNKGSDTSSVGSLPLFIITIQYPIKPDLQTHSSLVIFNLQEINVCVDPLVCKWLIYHPLDIAVHRNEERYQVRNVGFSDIYSSVSETPRRTTLIESVHSSSDRDVLTVTHQKLPTIEEEEPVDLQEQIYNFLKKWHPVWKCMILSGQISQCVIYFPMASISSVGTQGVEDAIKEALKSKVVNNVMVITLPMANISSAQKQSVIKYLHQIPIKLPESIWSLSHSSFPWSVSISDLNCFAMEPGMEISFLKSVGISATIGLSTKQENKDFNASIGGSIGVYVHIDVTPILISVSEAQMYLLANLIYELSDFVNSLTPKKMELEKAQIPETLPSIASIASPSISPTAKDNTLDDTSGTIPCNDSLVCSTNQENVKLTAWIQWTITKFSMELLSHESDNSQAKLVIDVEDIVSSLDYQNVYLKLKKKIGSISIRHYKRSREQSKWSRGSFSGTVMRLREDVALEKRPEDGGLLGITITRASSQHTHNLWGTARKNKEKRLPQITTSRYLTEIVISVQPIDVILSMRNLLGFYKIFAPFLDGPSTTPAPTSENNRLWFSNQNLPLAYLDCKEIRILMPSSELLANTTYHDVIMLQVEKISFSPSVTNPICRTPIRPDIYRQAAQARILTIPGSELEERQYQLDIVGLSGSTSTWKDLEQILNIRGNFNLSENPALEWNNLKQGKLTIAPTLNITQVIEKFDITIVAAPPMIYRNDILICNNSFEINFVTDIAISISLDQLKLGACLYNEFRLPITVPTSNLPEIKSPFTKFDNLNNDLEAELTEFYKDSGIDTSEIRSMLSTKSAAQPMIASKKTVRENPSEILFTAGKISCCLYQTSITSRLQRNKSKYAEEDDCNYEASEEESVDEAVRNHKKYHPLLFIFLSQPNVYSSSQSYVKSTHLSCFDFSVKLGSKNETISAIPTVKDFSIDFLKTRTGYPDTVTGILPAFFTLKYTKEYGKNASYLIEFSRPTKISCSIANVVGLMTLKQKIFENLLLDMPSEVPNEATQSKFRQIRERFKGIEMVQFKTEQLMFALESSHNMEANLVFNRTTSRLFLGDRPEKINLFATLECMTFAIVYADVKKLLLNPWTVTIESSASLESWQSADGEPQINVSVDSDCLMIDVSPEQLVWLDKIIKELTDFGNSFIGHSTTNNEFISKKATVEIDQHYKDDLRAGAFQFIEASNTGGDELPLPYQVMFWNSKDLCAMAWRYPQPRALIKVRIFPVPLEISFDEEPSQVSCILQYWSDHHCSYVSYASFNLSESDVCYLDLPKEEPQRAVAYIWRVILKSFNKEGKKMQKSIISPRALAACMRIDSYFNKLIVPTFTMVVYVSKLELSLISAFEQKDAQLPKCLKHFSSDQAFLKTHCFFRMSATNIKYHMASWDWIMLTMDLSAIVKCSTLDYTYLTEQSLLEPVTFKSELNVAKKLAISFISKPIQIVIGPTITHTLTVNSQLWFQVRKTPEEKNFVVFTRYVICNDTNINLRFGQVATDEDILLPSRCFHLYCWRSQKSKRKLKVAFAERGWLWSKPFKIDEESTQVVALTLDSNLSVIVIIKNLSSTQKQITIAGQFVIANMLLEHFDFKIFPETKDDREVKKAQVHVLGGKNITPSMFIDHTANYYFRLRFFGLESAWTGDIPLKEHTRGAQPWLVKVPLQERGQFLSIWCRIVVQDHHKCKRILAMLWPLFMVKSNFPISFNTLIDTPSLNVRLDSVVKGKGELKQLYCPGTIDHSHHLHFKMEDDSSALGSYIPLHYSLVDHQKFFKKSEKENIDDILNSLQVYDVSKWPYLGEDLENIDWIVDNQPQTAIQVRYQNASPYSSALLMELLPWCLVANTFGCPISFMVNGIELCRIPQYGIVAPPKFDNNFHLGLDLGGGLFYSSALHLSNSDWSQTFYMPKITGTLPIDGTIKIAVKCGQDIAMVSLTSSLTNEIRLLRLSSTHIFSNYLTNQIQVVCFAVPDNGNIFTIPENADQFSFSIAPQSDKTNSGISIIRWHTLDSDIDNMNYVLYISFCFQYEFGWSLPVRVDDNITRRSISLRTINDEPVSLVLTSNERKDQMYLSLYHDDCPQTLIDNRIDVNLCCGQSSNEGLVVFESKHFDWFTQIEAGKCMYYTMPFICEKFPELPQNCFNEKIVFALSREDESSRNWSTPISLIGDSEQFVKIPDFGDVKILVKVTSYTTLVTVNSVNEVEFSALDIRGRLSRCLEMENNVVEPSTSDNCRIESHSNLNLSQINLYKSLFVPTIPQQNDWTSVEILVYVKSFSVGFLQDYSNDTKRYSIANFTIDGLGMEINQMEHLNFQIYISDLQFDNELYLKEPYDFPVVLVSQDPKPTNNTNVLETSPQILLEKIHDKPIVAIDLVIESWLNNFCNNRKTSVKEVKLKVNPISLYIEDTYINKLVDYFNHLFPRKLVTTDKYLEKMRNRNGVEVKVPEIVLFDSFVAAKPLNLKSITIESLSLLLSVHSSLKMYIALDQSPLQFAKFGRKLILTTPYRFGHAMTMHYLSGAIFGAGWVVSSLELLGSPSGLARAMGMGLRDFINLPYRGFIQGPWGFLTGVTHGSASLMKHVTAGTLQSVTKLASSVARNLDRLTLDEEHLRRTEEQRRMKPQGVTQGFMLGLTGLGISLLGAVGGIAHHTLQSLMAEGPSPRSLAAGVGLGLVGVFTKPLSGAAELVALTGQGLLQGAGWNPLPQPRNGLLENISSLDETSPIKYEWKLLNAITYKKILYVTEATIVTNTDFKGIVLILASDALIIVNIDDDTVRRIISLGQLSASASDNDPTYLIFKIVKTVEEENVVEMDPACRARVADYVKNTATILNINREEEAETSPLNPIQNNTDDQFGCYVNPQNRNYFVCLLLLAKQLNNDFSFPVL